MLHLHRNEPKAGSTDARSAAGGTTQATVLFVDLRGYTGLAERLPPPQILPLLNELFDILVAATDMHRGRIYHLAGDGLMAGFGIDDPASAGAGEALAAGTDMLRQFAPVAIRWRRELSIEAGIGVGIHCGEVATGFIGAAGRQAATMVGDTVNVAARLCGRARAGEVLFSAAVASALDAAHAMPAPESFLRLPKFALRGRSAPLDIWCVPAVERLAI